ANPDASRIDVCSTNSAWHSPFTTLRKAFGRACSRPREYSDKLLRLTPLAAKPLADRLPLFPVRRRQILRKFEHTHAARIRANIVLRLAQTAQIRDFQLGEILVQFLVAQRV